MAIHWRFLVAVFWLGVFSCYDAIESPSFTVVYSDSDFVIRLYNESAWMSALVRGTSFQNSTRDGFHRLYQYIHGANLNSSHLTITAPILTSITSSARGFEYDVRYYLPAKYEGAPPQPNAELNLQFYKWGGHCVAVRNFTNFAKDAVINKELDSLVTSLDKLLKATAIVLEDKNSFTIAQYNSSRHRSGRLNEVWMNVLGFAAVGCPSY